MDDESADEYYIQAGPIRLDTPLRPAMLGYNGLRISKLLTTIDNVALDYGFSGTASCGSSITYIDSTSGILRYQGYPIEESTREPSFVEVIYLLIYGELPDRVTLDLFVHRVRHNRPLPEDFPAFLGAFLPKGHPMSML